MHRFLFALLACSIPLAAQSWEDLRGLKPGDRVKVRDTAGERTGTFRAVSADDIRIETGKNEVTIERARVRRVQVKSTSRRVRNVVIGAAIGVAVGVILDQSLGTYFRNESGQSSGARAFTYIAPIGLFGGIAAIPAGYRTVYRAR